MFKQLKQTLPLLTIIPAEVIENALLSFLEPTHLWQFIRTGTVSGFAGYKNLLMQLYKEKNHEKQQQFLTALFLQQSDLPIATETKDLYLNLINFLIEYASYPHVSIENRLLALANAVIYSYKLSKPNDELLSDFDVLLELVKKIKPEWVNSILAEVACAQQDEEKFKGCLAQHNILKIFRGGYTQYNKNEMAVILKPFLAHYRGNAYELFLQLSDKTEIYGKVNVAAQWNSFDIIQVFVRIMADEVVAPVSADFIYNLTEKLYKSHSLNEDIISTTAVCFLKLPEEMVVSEIDRFSAFIQNARDNNYKILLIMTIGKIGEKTPNVTIRNKCLEVLQALLRNNFFLAPVIQAMGGVLQQSNADTAWRGVCALHRFLAYKNPHIVQAALTAIKKSLAVVSKLNLLDIFVEILPLLSHSDIKVKTQACKIITEIALSFPHNHRLRQYILEYLLNFLNDKAIRSSIITAVITLWRTQPDLKLQEQIYPLVVDALQGDSERNNAVKQINLLMKLLTPEECLRFLEAIFVLKNINDIIAEDNIQDLCVKLLLKMSGASCFLNMFQQFKNLLLVREEPLSVDYHRVATIIFAVPHLITQRHQYIVELRPLIQSEDTEIQAIAIASITQLISGPGLELQQQRREMLALLKPFLDHENLALRTSAVLATADLFASMPRRTIDRAPRLQESNARDTSILPSVKDNNSFIFSHRAQTGGEVTQTQKEKENTKDHRPH